MYKLKRNKYYTIKYFQKKKDLISFLQEIKDEDEFEEIEVFISKDNEWIPLNIKEGK